MYLRRRLDNLSDIRHIAQHLRRHQQQLHDQLMRFLKFEYQWRGHHQHRA
jgi:hypothetical protein